MLLIENSILHEIRALGYNFLLSFKWKYFIKENNTNSKFRT